METRVYQDGRSVILADCAIKPEIDRHWFDPHYWQQQGGLRHHGDQRGAPSFITTPAGELVLRHYRRGGLIAKISYDRYLWQGHQKVRAIAEFTLLQTLLQMQLPVPEPIAARYSRHGLTYRADILTRRIPDVRTVGDLLQTHELDGALMQCLGKLVARFHQHGLWHADLNADNLLVAADALYMIDFDRCRLRKPEDQWQWSNVARLRRSLCKLGGPSMDEKAFQDQLWRPFLRGYGKRA